MPHQRLVIRHAVRDRLLGATAAEDRVFTTRLVPYRRTKLPAIAVYTRAEPVDPESRNTAPRELTRNLQLVIEVAVAEGSSVRGVPVAVDQLDDALDGLAVEVERVMDADPWLGGAAGDSLLTSTDVDVIVDVDGRALEQPIGLVTLTYAITYRTQAPDPADVPLDDFKRATIRHDLSGIVSPKNVAEDDITLPTK